MQDTVAHRRDRGEGIAALGVRKSYASCAKVETRPRYGRQQPGRDELSRVSGNMTADHNDLSQHETT